MNFQSFGGVGVACLFWLALLIGALSGDEPAADSKPASESPPLTAEQLAKSARQSVVVVLAHGRDEKEERLGTGFVISADGLIVTNRHVIGESRPIAIRLLDGRRIPVTAVHASDRELDLAVLRVEEKELAPLELGDSANLRNGEPIVVIGNPAGLAHSVVSGVISGRREIAAQGMIQLAIPIEQGNSGSPVLDGKGRVIGVVTAKSAVTNNLGFAVEVNLLKPLLERPNPIPMERWLSLGLVDESEWSPLFGARWLQRGGRILVRGTGQGFGGRSLCLAKQEPPAVPFEIAVTVKLDHEGGAAGLAFHADGKDRHYGFYPTNGKLRLTAFDGPDVYSWRVLRELPSEHYRAGTWNHLKVRIEKDRLLCFVNDQLVIESTDQSFTSGRVGLAKFRDTQAEFKQFQIAEKIGPSQIPRETIAQLNESLDRLPGLSALNVEQLQPFNDNNAVAVIAARERAQQLERRAIELRQIASDLHTRYVTGELKRLTEMDADNFDLLAATLLLAKLDDEGLDVASYVRQVERMAEAAKQALPGDADGRTKLTALNEFLFQKNGYHGSRYDYYHRANSYMNRVIDDREGLPITLSVLYMELARRMGVTVQGVALPGHFVVKHQLADGSDEFLDVFSEGTVLTREDLEKRVREAGIKEFRDEHLRKATPAEILQRMLRNLLRVAEQAKDKEATLRYLETLIAVNPDLIEERGWLAIKRHETGRVAAALADLDWFLEHKPAGVDLDGIRQMREAFSRP